MNLAVQNLALKSRDGQYQTICLDVINHRCHLIVRQPREYEANLMNGIGLGFASKVSASSIPNSKSAFECTFDNSGPFLAKRITLLPADTSPCNGFQSSLEIHHTVKIHSPETVFRPFPQQPVRFPILLLLAA